MNIAIYGAGQYGKYVRRILEGTNGITVPCFYDSDENKWGEYNEGMPIKKPDSIGDEDGIIIAIRDKEEKDIIEKKILDMAHIRVYEEIHEIVAERVYWDVSGWCNAKCNYCITGRMNNTYASGKRYSYMKYEEFVKFYSHLYEKSLISRETDLGLYNWRESFLNPDIMKILKYLSDNNQKYSLSTNGSVFRKANDKDTYRKCETITFSMPGFSQKSYDRAHGFNFNQILENIKLFRDDMLENGFEGQIVIAAHKYKYSVSEMPALCEWAESNGIRVNSYFPYLAGNTLIEEYFLGRMDDEQRLREELFLDWTDSIPEIPSDFINPLCNIMTIDEKGRWTLCCAADPYSDDYDTWGYIKDIVSYEQYLQNKKSMLKSKSCAKCRKYGMAYRILNN